MNLDISKTSRARALRKRQTPAEEKMWYYLRARRFMKLKFRRQVPLGRYYVDFECREYKIVVEVDGFHHASEYQKEYDKKRTIFLEDCGYTVLRVWNNQILHKTDSTLDYLHVEISKIIQDKKQ